MQKFQKQDFSRVRPLLDTLRPYHVSIDAVLEGHNPGTVYGDDTSAPQVAFLLGAEGGYLGGQPTPQNISAVKTLIAQILPQSDELWLACTPAWDEHIGEILPWPPLDLARQHYTCTALKLDWRAALPQGFTTAVITQELLDTPGLDIPDHVFGWMHGNWGSVEACMVHGFGTVTMDTAQNAVVSWSICDCKGDGACEIGIHTRDDYRRKGLAAITAAAAVEHALGQGYRAVGWHCNTENTGSARTALKVGFVHDHDYVHHVVIADETAHRAELARRAR